MDALANAIILSWGWRRRGWAFGAGAVSALAQPPFFAFPLLWLTFPVLVWLIDGAAGQTRRGRARRFLPAFSVGWWFGFGYFLAGLWWVGSAFLVEAEVFGWLMPIAVLALPAGLALFWGFGAAAAQMLWCEDWRRIFALAAGLGGAEWLRGTVLTGFPWNSLGYALTAGEAMMQSASLFGLHALSVLAVLIFAGPAAMTPTPALRERHVALPIVGLTLLAALGCYGVLRLYAGENAFAQDTTIRVVQPNLDQLQKWRPENRETVLRTYLALSAPEDAPLPAGAVLVWPESAFPFALTEDPEALGAIADLLPPGTALVTGAYRQEHDPSGEQRFFNSIYVIGDDGTILDAYDKTHLVPFGEYLPAGAALGPLGLRQMVQDGFSAGPRRRSLNLPSAPPFSPLICYEAIFSGAVLGEGPRPGFLVNVTNDGWFGRTVGPHQHFHQARLRSVEEGLPMVRAANTGISAVIDPYGRIAAKTRLAQAQMFETRLPRAIEPTFYSKWRGNVVLVLLVVCVITAGTKILHPAYRV
jgi:apolipoprotein N-acyltransferase